MHLPRTIHLPTSILELCPLQPSVNWHLHAVLFFEPATSMLKLRFKKNLSLDSLTLFELKFTIYAQTWLYNVSEFLSSICLRLHIYILWRLN